MAVAWAVWRVWGCRAVRHGGATATRTCGLGAAVWARPACRLFIVYMHTR